MKTIARLPTVGCLGLLLAAFCLLPTGLAGAQENPPPAAPGAEGAVNINARGTVELHVQGADLRRVLQLLSTQSKTNIIASKSVVGTVTADLYGVTFEEALDAVLRSAGFSYVREKNFIYVLTAKEWADWQASRRGMVVKVFRLSYVTATDAKTFLAPAMSADGTVAVTPAAEVGVGSSSDASGGNSFAAEDVIVVRDYAENIEKVTKILQELDIRPQQVLIEATILRATLEETNALGIDFNALAGVDFRSLSSASTGMTSIEPGAVPEERLDKGAATFRTDLTTGMTPGGLTIGFISNNVSFFIRALEGVTDIATLANPKLLVVNKQRGEVMVGNRDGYITTTFTETTATQTVEFLETGTQLVVRPFIGSDGYIRLEIHPEDSTGGLTAQQLPYEKTTECTSNVLVKDGHTIVIGGLFRERTNNARSQVPGLGNIPLLGIPFRRRSERTEREEVIILITPHIIKQPVAEIACEQVKDDVMRFRFGIRQGLMWFGRDRLAQTHMRRAREALAAGDRRKALWNVNMALSLQSRMEEALRLKERLTRQAIWASESRFSSIGFIIQQMILQELGQPTDRVTPPYKPRDGMQLRQDIRDALGIGPRPELPLTGPAEKAPEATTRPAKDPSSPKATPKPAK